MRMNHQTFAMRKNQATNRFWVNQKLVAYEHAHDLFESRMMRQSVKRFQVEYFLVGPLERWVGIAASRAGIGDAFERIVTRQQPARGVKDLSYLAK